MALNYILQNNFKPNVGMRPDARKIGVLITDGKSQDDVVYNSQILRDNDIELYAIGEPAHGHAHGHAHTTFSKLPGRHECGGCDTRPSLFQA